MSKKITNKKHIKYLTALCVSAYFASYITRINYGAIILELVKSENILKSVASLVTTASFITYGVGQLVSGYLGDRYRPSMIVFWGLILTSIMNLLMPLCTDIRYMTVVWGLNGLAQAMMWPPIVKILSNLLTKSDYEVSSTNVILGGSFGTIAVYAVSPILIMLSGWRLVFWVSSAIGFTMALIFIFAINKIEAYAEESGIQTEENMTENHESEKVTKGIILSSGLSLIMLAIILQGALRDGITTWMPTYISEVYKLGNSISILTGIILPVFSIVGLQLAGYFYRKMFRSEIHCSIFMFLLGLSASVLLGFFFKNSVVLSILLSAVITGAMHGVNLMLICMVPLRFNKYNMVSTVAGAVNFCTYIGSAISTFGIALLSEHIGWQGTIFSWAALAFLGMLSCVIVIPKWKKFINR